VAAAAGVFLAALATALATGLGALPFLLRRSRLPSKNLLVPRSSPRLAARFSERPRFECGLLLSQRARSGRTTKR